MRGFLYWPFADRAAALQESEARMRALQTPATQADPKTVTKALFHVSVNPGTLRASLVVPPRLEGRVPAPSRGSLKVESRAVADGDAAPRINAFGMVVVDDVERAPEAGGRGGGGGGR